MHADSERLTQLCDACFEPLAGGAVTELPVGPRAVGALARGEGSHCHAIVLFVQRALLPQRVGGQRIEVEISRVV